MNFLWKKEPDPPPWGRSWAQDACTWAARSAVFKRKLKMEDEASQVNKVIQKFNWLILQFLQDLF